MRPLQNGMTDLLTRFQDHGSHATLQDMGCRRQADWPGADYGDRLRGARHCIHPSRGMEAFGKTLGGRVRLLAKRGAVRLGAAFVHQVSH